MDTCRRKLIELSFHELRSKAISLGHRGYSKLCKAQLINLIERGHPNLSKTALMEGKDDSLSPCPRSPQRKDLMKICKERKIKYATIMTKQQMIEVLRMNDEDPSVNVHPDAQKRVQNKYKAKLNDRREGELESHSPRGNPLEKEQATRSPQRKDLMKICKERKIKYAAIMTKQEMIEVLRMNDEDSSVNVHPDAQKRVTQQQQNKYRDNPKLREKARECTRRWRINNPEKAKEHLIKWQERITLCLPEVDAPKSLMFCDYSTPGTNPLIPV